MDRLSKRSAVLLQTFSSGLGGRRRLRRRNCSPWPPRPCAQGQHIQKRCPLANKLFSHPDTQKTKSFKSSASSKCASYPSILGWEQQLSQTTVTSATSNLGVA